MGIEEPPKVSIYLIRFDLGEGNNLRTTFMEPFLEALPSTSGATEQTELEHGAVLLA